MNKAELIITALQQRIGEIVSQYESQIAVLRAEVTQLVNDKQAMERQAEINKQELQAKISNVVQEHSDTYIEE